MKKLLRVIYEYVTRPSQSHGWGVEIKKHVPTHTVESLRPISSIKDVFYDAIKQNDNHTVTTMIASKPNLMEELNEQGLTPLMQAVTAKNYTAIEILISNGADVSRADEDGWTARTWAIFIKDIKAQQLLSHNSSILINSNDSSGTLFGVIAMNQREKNDDK
ncbi:MAG: hypothetical protein GQ531_10480 [Sulfurovum sp.]|nr:hypothetical protein [Sulfurovum sp.]